ncbi:MAG: hypothetical protein QM733_14100 [Ilumatobacteraceae bacterium]
MAGVEVVPTFRTPHVTRCHVDLRQLIERLIACKHDERQNPHHVPDEDEAVSVAVDLRVDLNTEDDTGLPWAFLRDARDPSIVREGAWLIVGSGNARAVAQVAQVDGDLVWVRPLPGPVSRYRDLVGDRGAA